MVEGEKKFTPFEKGFILTMNETHEVGLHLFSVKSILKVIFTVIQKIIFNKKQNLKKIIFLALFWPLYLSTPYRSIIIYIYNIR